MKARSCCLLATQFNERIKIIVDIEMNPIKKFHCDVFKNFSEFRFSKRREQKTEAAAQHVSFHQIASY